MKNPLLALLSGLLLALAWPTYGFPLLLFVAFVPLLWVTKNLREHAAKRKGWKVFGHAYLAFFVFNIITTWWLYYSTTFGMWFAVICNALLMAMTWQLYYWVSKRLNGTLSIIFLIAIWMLFEWMHLSWEFSWPWLNLGNGFASYINWVQWYEYTGTFGGTLWVLAANVILFQTFFGRKEIRSKTFGIIAFAGIVVLPIGVSYFILSQYEETENLIEVVLLQPNIDPYTEKYNETNEQIANLLFTEANKSLTKKTDYLIAPETVLAEGYGVDLNNFNYSAEKKKATDFLKKYPNLNYLAGIQFFRFHRNEADLISTSNYLGEDRMGNPVWGDFYNSAFLLNAQDTSQIYHKSKLVVGVENFPYQDILKPLLGDFMIDLGGTVSMKSIQKDRTVFRGSDNNLVAPVICYESVYGEFVTDYVKNGAQFLAIITNDAWWSESQGHKQHLAYASLRAVENRRSIARSANTGISAIIDQTGHVQEALGYGIQGTVKGKLNLNSELTFYSRHGDYLTRIALVIALLLFVLAAVKKFFGRRSA
ncbi:MAG: apolipoprotein N-acyltransferase [Leeuwenhoekiella sp.]